MRKDDSLSDPEGLVAWDRLVLTLSGQCGTTFAQGLLKCEERKAGAMRKCSGVIAGGTHHNVRDLLVIDASTFVLISRNVFRTEAAKSMVFTSKPGDCPP